MDFRLYFPRSFSSGVTWHWAYSTRHIKISYSYVQIYMLYHFCSTIIKIPLNIITSTQPSFNSIQLTNPNNRLMTITHTSNIHNFNTQNSHEHYTNIRYHELKTAKSIKTSLYLFIIIFFLLFYLFIFLNSITNPRILYPWHLQKQSTHVYFVNFVQHP